MAEESLLPADTNIMPFDTTQNDAAAIDQLARDPDTIDLTQSLLQSGATGDPEIDTSLGALGVIQSVTAAGGGTKEIGDALLGQSPAMRQAAQEALLAASGARQTTPAQLIASAVLQIAPLLAGGALGGTEGALAGVGAGTAGRGAFEGLLDEDFESRQKAQKELALSDLAQAAKAEELGLQSILAATKAEEAEERQQRLQDRKFSQDIQLERLREATRNAGFSGAGAEALSEAILAATEKRMPQFTPEQRQAISKDKDLSGRVTQLLRESGIGNRFGERITREDMRNIIPGVDIIPIEKDTQLPDGTVLKRGTIPTLPAKAVEQGRIIKDGRDTMLATIEDLEKGLKGGQSITGAEALTQARQSVKLILELKKVYNLGANFTEMEAALLDEIIPKLAANPRLSLWKAFSQSQIFGKDPAAALQSLKSEIIRDTDFQMRNRGMRISTDENTSSPPSAESPRQRLERLRAAKAAKESK